MKCRWAGWCELAPEQTRIVLPSRTEVASQLPPTITELTGQQLSQSEPIIYLSMEPDRALFHSPVTPHDCPT